MPISRVNLRATARTHATRGALRVAVIGVILVMAGVVAGLEAPSAFAWKAPQVAALCATDASTSIQSTPAPTQQTAVLSFASLPLTGGAPGATSPSAALLVSMGGLTAFLVGFGVFVLSLNRQDRREHIRIRVEEDERE